MPPKKSRIKKKKRHFHILFILILILAGTFLIHNEFGRERVPGQRTDIPAPEEETASLQPVPEVKPAPIPPAPPSPGLPKIAIIVDDLGLNRKAARAVFSINAPITISILPLRPHSRWIAEEAMKRGHDIIAHIPMETVNAHKLGKGGLYTWMSRHEITSTLNKDLQSIPYIKGVSSHMGSAFTQDEKSMRGVIVELKKQGLFFLDSLTIPKTVGYRIAKEEGIGAFRRDVFLDNTDDPVEIQKEWKRLINIARLKGYAIALAHPRDNTIEFLRKTLKDNNAVTLVPLSELNPG